MADDRSKVSRRDLFKLGAAGAGAMAFTGIAGAPGIAEAQEKAAAPLPQVPRRKLGKTGKDIPILLMGGAMPLDPKLDPKLAECMRFGVNYIDAADCYSGGQCEGAVGNFLRNAKVDRSKVWITSKSDAHDPAGFEQTLEVSLSRMGVPYIDLYFLHALQDGAFLTPELAARVEKLKNSGKIRHFGFSCHDGNVAELLRQGAKLPWVEAIMFRYNFRQYGDKDLNEAMDACANANVGLIAMKTQGSEASFADAWQKFERERWTKHQSVLKAVWADKRITAAVSHMDSMEKLKQNVAAAVDKLDFGQADFDALRRYGEATRGLACHGCDQYCGAAVSAPVKIGTTMRYLMYHDVYGETQKARELFARLPQEAQALDGVDFTGANAACPHGVDVAWHMRRASAVLRA